MARLAAAKIEKVSTRTAVLEAAKKVLSNEAYRRKAKEIEEEMMKFDAIESVVKNIEELSSQE